MVWTAFESGFVRNVEYKDQLEKVQLTFCPSVGEEADLGFELARRVCRTQGARRTRALERSLCEALSDARDMILVCDCR